MASVWPDQRPHRMLEQSEIAELFSVLLPTCPHGPDMSKYLQ